MIIDRSPCSRVAASDRRILCCSCTSQPLFPHSRLPPLLTPLHHEQVCQIDPKWLVEMAPRFFKAADPHRLSRRKRHERIEPLYDRWAGPGWGDVSLQASRRLLVVMMWVRIIGCRYFNAWVWVVVGGGDLWCWVSIGAQQHPGTVQGEAGLCRITVYVHSELAFASGGVLLGPVQELWAARRGPASSRASKPRKACNIGESSLLRCCLKVQRAQHVALVQEARLGEAHLKVVQCQECLTGWNHVGAMLENISCVQSSSVVLQSTFSSELGSVLLLLSLKWTAPCSVHKAESCM